MAQNTIILPCIFYQATILPSPIKISLVKTPQLIKIYYLFRDESKAATMIRLIKKDILTESSMDEGGNHVYHLFFIWIGAKKAPFPFCFDHWFPFKSFCIHLFPCMYYFADDVVSPNTWHYFCCWHNLKKQLLGNDLIGICLKNGVK